MIVVTCDSEVVGAGEFWRGNESDIEQIRNIVAHSLARAVVQDGHTRSKGMWTVSQQKDTCGEED